MLMDHPDAGLDRVARGAERDVFSLQKDLACVGVIQAVQNVHESRLARAVLTEQRMHLASPTLQCDVVIRDDARKLLADAAHLENELLGHWEPILT